MSKEAMKLALEALEYIEHNYMSLPAPAEKAITALREALAEQPAQQEPVTDEENEKFSRDVSNFKGADPEATKYALEEFLKNRTSPPAQRKPLTVDEVWQNDQLMSLNAELGCSMDLLMEVVEAIEAALGIKENT